MLAPYPARAPDNACGLFFLFLFWFFCGRKRRGGVAPVLCFSVFSPETEEPTSSLRRFEPDWQRERERGLCLQNIPSCISSVTSSQADKEREASASRAFPHALSSVAWSATRKRKRGNGASPTRKIPHPPLPMAPRLVMAWNLGSVFLGSLNSSRKSLAVSRVQSIPLMGRPHETIPSDADPASRWVLTDHHLLLFVG